MALIACPECGAGVSDQAWSCRSCGARNRQHWLRRGGRKVGMLVIPVIVTGLILGIACLMSLAF